MKWRNIFKGLTATLIVGLAAIIPLGAEENIPELPDYFNQMIQSKIPNATQIVQDTYNDKESYYGSTNAKLLSPTENLDHRNRANYYNALIHMLVGLGIYLEQVKLSDAMDTERKNEIIGIINVMANYYNNDLTQLAAQVRLQKFNINELYSLQQKVIHFCASTIALGMVIKENTPKEESAKAVY